MWNFLGGLVGGIGSLLGGSMSSSATAAANTANINEQNYLDTHHIQDVVSDAKAAGINPLAALGVNTPSAPVQVGNTGMAEGVAHAGQDIGRAVSSLDSPQGKSQELQDQLLKLQISGAEQDVVSKQLANSKAARTLASPGTAPTFHHAGTMADPIPATSYYDAGGRPFMGASKEFANTQFGPTAWVTGAPLAVKILGENALQMGRTIGDDFSSAAASVRPDVARYISNVGLPPTGWEGGD